MPTRRTSLTLFCVTIAAIAVYPPSSTLATAAQGYEINLLAMGRLGATDAVHFFAQQTKGLLDVYVQNNVWVPGGSTGWHSHPGYSLIIVTAGTVTDYEGHDPGCKPHVYETGMAFVDPGGGRVHILRNEGAVEAKTIAVQFIPADRGRRMEVEDPGNCHF